MRTIFPLVQTVLVIAIWINWMSTTTDFDFPLYVFGVVSGIAIASWINYFRG
jgi:hypothetical protein